MTVYGQNTTLAMAVSLWDTATTHTTATTTTDKRVYTYLFEAAATGITSPNVPREIDFTLGGQRKGIWIQNWPAIKVDSGTNTPTVYILYQVASKNKVQP